MKTVTLLLLMCVVSYCHSQIALANKSSFNPDSTILFIGVKNEIEIKGQKSTDKMILSCSSCQVFAAGQNKFDVYVMESQYHTLSVNSKKKRLIVKNFRGVPIPPPVAQLGRLADSVRTVQRILSDPSLYIELLGSLYKHDITVVSFEIVLYGEEVISYPVHGNSLPADAQKQVKSLKSGNRIEFQNIKASTPDARVRLVPSFSITIK